jgi:hypothetical protein
VVEVPDARLLRLARLAPDVHLTRRIRTDQHYRKARDNSLFGKLCATLCNAVTQSLCDGAAVDERSGQLQIPQ